MAPERVAALARGFNLTGWVDGLTVRRPSPTLLAALRTRGFTHVRLPLLGELAMPRFADARARAARLAELDVALDTLLRAGYAVIIDLHPGGKFATLAQSDPDAAEKQVEAAWLTLAARERQRPGGRVFFELLNEPPIADATWTAWLRTLLPAVRRAAPNRTLIVGPAPFQRSEALAAWPPFSDPNIVYAFHFYDPMAFTHQGASWDPTSAFALLEHVPFPAKADDGRVAAQIASLEQNGHAASAQALREGYAHDVDAVAITGRFADVAAWSARYDRPVILDEFGVLADVAPAADRRAWIAAVRKAAEASCFGWSHWEFDQGFGFVDRRTGRPDEGIVDALLGSADRGASTRR